jgi:hypothetical protein
MGIGTRQSARYLLIDIIIEGVEMVAGGKKGGQVRVASCLFYHFFLAQLLQLSSFELSC